jgi:carbonic anhydrase
MKIHVFSTSLLMALSGTAAVPAWAEDPHWNYEEQSEWGSITDAAYNPPYPYAECSLGGKQSPLDLARQPDLSDVPLIKNQNGLKFQYQAIPLSVDNNGHTLKVSLAAGTPGELLIGRDHYSLLQFHFHAPSEHQIAGKTYPLEVHFVHGTQDGKLAVVGVFFKAGKANPDFQAILDNAPAAAGQTNTPAGVELAPLALLPKFRGNFFAYAGSLTTPPCSEGVNWYVLKNPIQVSSKQIRQFQAFYSDNARHPQDPHGRVVIRK